MSTWGEAPRIRARGYAIGLVVFALLGCGKTIATLSYEGIGATSETPLALAAGSEVKFFVRAGSYSYSGRNHVMLDASLLKGGAVVGTMTCAGFDFEGVSGGGCSSTHYNSSCSMTVPANGADAVRVGTRLENDNSAIIDGLEVIVKQ